MVAQAYPLVAEPQSIKLLDLLTNRYYLGVIRESSDGGLAVELAAGGGGRFHAGQRVRFIVGDQPLFCRSAMQRGFVTQVSLGRDNCVSMQLAVMGEMAVA